MLAKRRGTVNCTNRSINGAVSSHVVADFNSDLFSEAYLDNCFSEINNVSKIIRFQTFV